MGYRIISSPKLEIFADNINRKKYGNLSIFEYQVIEYYLRLFLQNRIPGIFSDPLLDRSLEIQSHQDLLALFTHFEQTYNVSWGLHPFEDENVALLEKLTKLQNEIDLDDFYKKLNSILDVFRSLKPDDKDFQNMLFSNFENAAGKTKLALEEFLQMANLKKYMSKKSVEVFNLYKSKTYKRGFPETQCLCSQGNYAQTPR